MMTNRKRSSQKKVGFDDLLYENFFTIWSMKSNAKIFAVYHRSSFVIVILKRKVLPY